MTYISEYFYSNCLIEAIKAKIKHPIKVKIKYIPARLNEVFCPHLSEDDNYINIYESGADAAKKLNLSSSMISSVKSGRRKMRDNSYFKYYKDFNKEEQEKIKEKFQEYFK